ncbi:unnamed protein product [Diabrotica balteata]|uniref:Reverse transcriptase domain-containing protein n=1 Tax=Diabrotica balteata TaxID=107213 RepID=A0A9N9T1A6_DIABA|nr:unnamed protein product [Diabrotica balteata]
MALLLQIIVILAVLIACAVGAPSPTPYGFDSILGGIGSSLGFGGYGRYGYGRYGGYPYGYNRLYRYRYPYYGGYEGYGGYGYDDFDGFGALNSPVYLNVDDGSLLDRISYHQADKILLLSNETHKKNSNLFYIKKSHSTTSTSHSPLTKPSLSFFSPINKLQKAVFYLKVLILLSLPSRIPTEEIVSNVEAALRTIPKIPADRIRFDVAKCLDTAKIPTSNISREEFIALKNLRSLSEIIILPADKGNATVILDTPSYIEKVNDLLRDTSCYNTISRDPTPRVEREISHAIKQSDLSDEVKKSIVPKNSICPRIYGLPKIHKDNVPLRPIVTTINSPTYKLAKYLSNQFKTYTGRTSSYVRNSTHFITLISSLTVDPQDILVSFDVSSLFTNIPIHDSLVVLRDHLTNDNKSLVLADLAEKCLLSTYFSFRGNFYKQISGTPNGFSLSPVIADIFMEAFESLALESYPLKPKVWFRYVDDTFIIWPHGQHTLSPFLDHLNSQHPSIKFTMEVENNRSLPFLDVLVTSKPNGRLGHSVYRKKTHTNRYLHASSHHHPAQKNSVINSLIHRAISISEPDNLREELGHLQKTLVANGYSKSTIQNITHRHLHPPLHPRTTNSESSGNTPVAFLPIGKILRKEGIRTTFRPPKKISQYLPSPKDPLPPLSSCGVYSIPCSCGHVYIGETGRSVKTRIQEHQRCIRSGLFSHSAVAEHCQETGHSILFEKTHIISKSPFFYSRKIRESLEIRKNPHNINREEGYYLSPIWNLSLEPPSGPATTMQPHDWPARAS